MTISSNIKDSYQSLIETLKHERDELNLKMQLASMEMRDEWKKLEQKYAHLQSTVHQLNEATGESAHEIGEALSILADELKESYRRLKRAL